MVRGPFDSLRSLRVQGVLLMLCACEPGFERRPSQVDAPRILAIRSEPAEARPGTPVALTALLTDGSAPGYAFCLRQKPVADPNSVAQECALGEAKAIANPAVALLPADGCALFGSEAPPQTRPTDPDSTGGYYQPVRAGSGELLAFARVRLSCALARAPADAVRDFRDRYRANANPRATALTLTDGIARLTLDAPERYVAWDLAAEQLVEREERYRVWWFATAGRFDADVTDSAENRYAAAGPATLWAVVRDDRGGLAWAEMKFSPP